MWNIGYSYKEASLYPNADTVIKVINTIVIIDNINDNIIVFFNFGFSILLLGIRVKRNIGHIWNA